jgi:hypothetical protein
MFSYLLLTLLMADPCVSGVPIGKRPGPYSFLVATGTERGKQTCFICEQADKPAVVVFARTLTPELGKLLTSIDAEIPKRKDAGFKAWMTLLSEKADLDQLAKWVQKEGVKELPVGVFEDVDGPPAYKLNSEASVTILIFTKEKVVANFAFRANEFDEQAIKKVCDQIPIALGQAK